MGDTVALPHRAPPAGKRHQFQSFKALLANAVQQNGLELRIGRTTLLWFDSTRRTAWLPAL
jgi:hypothetical protein